MVRDCLHEQITSICSSFLVGETTKVNADKKFIIWLHEEVIGTGRIIEGGGLFIGTGGIFEGGGVCS